MSVEDSATDTGSSTAGNVLSPASQATFQFTPKQVLPRSVSDSASTGNTMDRLLERSPTANQQQGFDPQQVSNYLRIVNEDFRRTTDCDDSDAVADDTIMLAAGEEATANGENVYAPSNVVQSGGTVGATSQSWVVFPKNNNGTGCWHAYKLHVLTCANNNGWTDEQSCRFLRTRLVGDAALGLGSATQQQWDWSTLLKALDARYGVAGPSYVIKSQLRQLFQGEQQTFKDYADELVKSVNNDPATEKVDHRAILEQFKHGLYSPRVKQYVCKRAPATLNDAVRHANDCLAINNWIQSSELLNEYSKQQFEEMRCENDHLRQEIVAMRRTAPASPPAEPVVLPPMQIEVQATETSTAGTSNVDAEAVSTKRALSTQGSSSDLFSSFPLLSLVTTPPSDSADRVY